MSTSLSRRDALKVAAATAAGAVAAGVFPSCATADNRGGKGMMAAFAGAYQGGKYTLPKLPYDYDALAPLYEKRTLQIHHDRHHAGYVKGLNSTLQSLSSAREAGDYASIKALSRALAFHGSGHVLHTLFWNSMTPTGSDVPDSLGRAMKSSFGSVNAAQSQFVAATKAVEGSGWGVLAYEPIGGNLVILQSEKHQNLTIWGVVPLLVCDVWEHAYYLQFANKRGEWVDNFMKLANWKFAADQLEAAMGKETS